MTRRYLLVSLVTFLLLATLHAQESNSPVKKISPEQLNSWVSYLASDGMKGRFNGSPEMEEVAGWLGSRFREYGLKPFNQYPGYIQEYTFSSRGRSINERNILGFIPGTDPALKEQYILITAHFDHIGIGRPVDGDSIYNGADDNAAGTCTLLSIAKYFSDNRLSPGRSIFFASVSGEEMGLRGSGYLARNLPVDAGRIYVNLNFEMTGHSEYLGRGNYYMTGPGFSDLDEIISRYNQGSGFTLVDTIPITARLFYMSDNAAFARMSVNQEIKTGIPGGTFATTTFGDHIHAPTDEAGLFDFDNMALLVNHFADLVYFLSYTKEEINWTDSTFVRPAINK